MSNDDPDEIIRYIRLWHDVDTPNAPALRLAAQLAETIAAHARLRLPPAFDTPPADFAATLHDLRDRE